MTCVPSSLQVGVHLNGVHSLGTAGEQSQLGEDGPQFRGSCLAFAHAPAGNPVQVISGSMSLSGSSAYTLNVSSTRSFTLGAGEGKIRYGLHSVGVTSSVTVFAFCA